MRITPISISQTLRPMSPVIDQVGRVEKRRAPDAVAGRGRLSAGQNDATARNSRLSGKRRKMNWNGLGDAVDVLA